ncbi:MAG: acyl-ACP--UDP-N-acetylglucosamine O-acyltransferase [Vulcanimicrobiota bacterium]
MSFRKETIPIQKIHPTAIIEEGAQLASDVVVGPYSIIGKDVKIGKGTVIHEHVLITGWTTIGEDNEIFKGAVIGEAPQDLGYKGERSYVNIGNKNNIREYVTIHRGAEADGETVIGNENLLMAYCHIAHNCHLGNQIIMANYIGLAGHVVVEDQVVFGGLSGIHQYARIGRLAMIGGYSKIIQDIPPFVLVEGLPVRILSLNSVGMRRRGIGSESRNALKSAIALLTSRKYKRRELPDVIRNNVDLTPEVEHLIDFISRPSKKGLLMQAPHKNMDQYKERIGEIA